MVTGYLVQEFWNKEPKTSEEEKASQCENAAKQSALFLAFIRNFLGGKCRQHYWTRTNTDDASEAWSIYPDTQSNALHMWKVSQPPLLPSFFQKLRYEVYWANLRESLLAVMMQWKIMHLQRTEVITVSWYHLCAGHYTYNIIPPEKNSTYNTALVKLSL